jgi:F-type H+-transporting ATPase subunit a
MYKNGERPTPPRNTEGTNDVLALEFPKMYEILNWKDLFPSFNKIALIAVLATVISSVLFILATRKPTTEAPKGTRNFAEVVVDFIENGVIMQTMGKEGLAWTPFLLTMFLFIYLCNVPGVIPFFQMPATARMAVPVFLSLLVWVVFNATGVKHQGVGGYLKSQLFPPGVPKALYILVTPIEIISVFFVRPFSLAVRLFANMLAGHILLVTFALLSEALFQAKDKILIPVGVLPFFMLLFLTSFEVLVGFLQAYIFVMLAAVYINGAAHAEH